MINGKVYIGQSKNYRARWSRHKSDARLNKKSDHLYRSIRKYGEENFVLEALYEVMSISEADEIEIKMIAYYNSTDAQFGYNKALGGQGRRAVSEETRKKLSKAAKGRRSRLGQSPSSETRKLLSLSQKGNKHRLGYKTSEETKMKLSIINTGKKISEETKRKMSISMMKKNAGSKNGMYGKRSLAAKLTFCQAENIRKEYSNGDISMSKLAEKYKISKKAIVNIIQHKTYKNP